MTQASRDLPHSPHAIWLPYVMLAGASLFWAGNAIAGRALRGDIAPVGLNFGRWLVALVILLPVTYRSLMVQWPLVKANSRLFLALGLTGVTIFQTCLYLALQTTTAINSTLFFSLTPVVIVALSWILWRERLARPQTLGILLSLIGALFLIMQGQLNNLLAFQFNQGDLWMVLAVVLWAVYSVLLKKLPPTLTQPVILTATVLAGMLFLLPAFLITTLAGAALRLTPLNGLGILYVGIFPSVLAFLFWNRGVQAIGPNKAGMYLHLMPVFGAILSFVFLDEGLAFYHLVGAALVFGGIVLMSRGAAAPQEKSATNFTN